jgi:hypothetical protein
MVLEGGTERSGIGFLIPNVLAKVASTVWRAGNAAQNWGEAPAPQAQSATLLGQLERGVRRRLLHDEAPPRPIALRARRHLLALRCARQVLRVAPTRR